MREISLVSSDGDAEFDEKVTQYIKEGMIGCLICGAGNEHIVIGDADVADDGSTIDILHECASCGVTWTVGYVAFSIHTSKEVLSVEN